MATFASATDFTADSAPDTMLAAVDNAKGAPAVRMDVVRRNLRRLQTREFMSQWNTQKTADAIPIRAHGEHRTCNNQQPTSNIEHRTSNILGSAAGSAALVGALADQPECSARAPNTARGSDCADLLGKMSLVTSIVMARSDFKPAV